MRLWREIQQDPEFLALNTAQQEDIKRDFLKQTFKENPEITNPQKMEVVSGVYGEPTRQTGVAQEFLQTLAPPSEIVKAPLAVIKKPAQFGAGLVSGATLGHIALGREPTTHEEEVARGMGDFMGFAAPATAIATGIGAPLAGMAGLSGAGRIIATGLLTGMMTGGARKAQDFMEAVNNIATEGLVFTGLGGAGVAAGKIVRGIARAVKRPVKQVAQELASELNQAQEAILPKETAPLEVAESQVLPMGRVPFPSQVSPIQTLTEQFGIGAQRGQYAPLTVAEPVYGPMPSAIPPTRALPPPASRIAGEGFEIVPPGYGSRQPPGPGQPGFKEVVRILSKLSKPQPKAVPPTIAAQPTPTITTPQPIYAKIDIPELGLKQNDPVTVIGARRGTAKDISQTMVKVKTDKGVVELPEEILTAKPVSALAARVGEAEIALEKKAAVPTLIQKAQGVKAKVRVPESMADEVLGEGGIKSYKEGYLAEELREIPLRFRNNKTGKPLDEMVDIMVRRGWLPEGSSEAALIDGLKGKQVTPKQELARYEARQKEEALVQAGYEAGRKAGLEEAGAIEPEKVEVFTEAEKKAFAYQRKLREEREAKATAELPGRGLPSEAKPPTENFGGLIVPKTKTGEPIQFRAFRGTREKPIDEGMYGKGTYLTVNREYAANYGSIKEYQVSLQKPYEAYHVNQIEKLADDARTRAIKDGKTVIEQNEIASQTIRKKLEEQGYDGIILHSPTPYNEIIVFHPNKSLKVVAELPGRPGSEIQRTLTGEERIIPGARAEVTPEEQAKLFARKAQPLLVEPGKVSKVEQAKGVLPAERQVQVELEKAPAKAPKVEVESFLEVPPILNWRILDRRTGRINSIPGQDIETAKATVVDRAKNENRSMADFRILRPGEEAPKVEAGPTLEKAPTEPLVQSLINVARAQEEQGYPSFRDALEGIASGKYDFYVVQDMLSRSNFTGKSKPTFTQAQQAGQLLTEMKTKAPVPKVEAGVAVEGALTEAQRFAMQFEELPEGKLTKSARNLPAVYTKEGEYAIEYEMLPSGTIDKNFFTLGGKPVKSEQYKVNVQNQLPPEVLNEFQPPTVEAPIAPVIEKAPDLVTKAEEGIRRKQLTELKGKIKKTQQQIVEDMKREEEAFKATSTPRNTLTITGRKPSEIFDKLNKITQPLQKPAEAPKVEGALTQIERAREIGTARYSEFIRDLEIKRVSSLDKIHDLVKRLTKLKGEEGPTAKKTRTSVRMERQREENRLLDVENKLVDYRQKLQDIKTEEGKVSKVEQPKGVLPAEVGKQVSLRPDQTLLPAKQEGGLAKAERPKPTIQEARERLRQLEKREQINNFLLRERPSDPELITRRDNLRDKILDLRRIIMETLPTEPDVGRVLQNIANWKDLNRYLTANRAKLTPTDALKMIQEGERRWQPTAQEVTGLINKFKLWEQVKLEKAQGGQKLPLPKGYTSPPPKAGMMPLEPLKGQGLAELPKKTVAGTNLIRLDTDDSVKQFINGFQESYKGRLTELRRPVSFKQMREAADKVGIDFSIKDYTKLAGKTKELYAQMLAAREGYVGQAEAIRMLPTRIAQGDTEAVRALHPAVEDFYKMTELLYGQIQPNVARAVTSGRIPAHGLTPSAEALQDLMKTLRKQGVDPKSIADVIIQTGPQDLDKVMAFLLKARQPKFADKVWEAWANSLLSGPGTQIRNIIGGIVGIIDAPVVSLTQGILARGLSVVTRKPPKALPMEAKAQLFGFFRSIPEAGRNFLNAWHTELPQKLGTTTLEAPRPAIKGTTGRVVRTWFRLLNASDQFAKTMLYNSKVDALAYRKATLAGKTGAAKADMIAMIEANPPADIINAASKEMRYRSFQLQPHELAWFKNVGKALGAIRSIPGGRYVIPFLRSLLNLSSFTMERTPLEFGRVLLKQIDAAARGQFIEAGGKRIQIGGPIKMTSDEVMEQVAKATYGTIVLGFIPYILARMGYLTGDGPSNPEDRDILRAKGWQPNSLRVPGGKRYYSYAGYAPLAAHLRMAANIAEMGETWGEKELSDRLYRLGSGAIKGLSDTQFTMGIVSIVKAISDPDRGLQKYIDQFSRTVVPTLVSQAAGALDPYYRAPKGVIESIKARIPVISKTVPPRRDIAERPIKKEGGGIFRFFSPTTRSKEMEPAEIEGLRKRMEQIDVLRKRLQERTRSQELRP